MPAIDVTTPSRAPSSASCGPCSMCISRNAAGGGVSHPAMGRSPRPSAANASATETPSASRRSPSSGSSWPSIARLPNTPRPKRGPSSSRKATTAIVRCSSPRPIAATASSPPTTPRAPSKRPPSGGVSRCEPVQTSAGEGSEPGSRPTRLPAGSTLVSSPAASIHVRTRSWARCSPVPSPGRFVPRPAPIANSSSRRSRTRPARCSDDPWTLAGRDMAREYARGAMPPHRTRGDADA